MPLTAYEDFLDLSVKQLTDYFSVSGLNTSGRKVKLITPFLFYKNSFYKNHEAENRSKIKNFEIITPGSRPRDL